MYDLVGGSCKFFGICIDIAHRELLLCRGRIKKYLNESERERGRGGERKSGMRKLYFYGKNVASCRTSVLFAYRARASYRRDEITQPIGDN